MFDPRLAFVTEGLLALGERRTGSPSRLETFTELSTPGAYYETWKAAGPQHASYRNTGVDDNCYNSFKQLQQSESKNLPLNKHSPCFKLEKPDNYHFTGD